MLWQTYAIRVQSRASRVAWWDEMEEEFRREAMGSSPYVLLSVRQLPLCSCRRRCRWKRGERVGVVVEWMFKQNRSLRTKWRFEWRHSQDFEIGRKTSLSRFSSTPTSAYNEYLYSAPGISLLLRSLCIGRVRSFIMSRGRNPYAYRQKTASYNLRSSIRSSNGIGSTRRLL